MEVGLFDHGIDDTVRAHLCAIGNLCPFSYEGYAGIKLFREFGICMFRVARTDGAISSNRYALIDDASADRCARLYVCVQQRECPPVDFSRLCL